MNELALQVLETIKLILDEPEMDDDEVTLDEIRKYVVNSIKALKQGEEI